jgi:UDP-N-acetylmuramoyl-tripeptide--D-alanyl-D-alanine ligase
MRSGGVAVLNADDPRVAAMSSAAKGRNITYAIDAAADVRAANIQFPRFGETTFTLETPDGAAEVSFPLNGRHNISNALAAAAVGFSQGVPVAAIGERLSSVAPPPQRGEVLHFAKGFTVINDSYNSNPTALLSMVQTLIEGAVNAKRRIVVAGEMLELGTDAAAIHRETGEAIGRLGIDVLIGVRGLAAELVAGGRDAGVADARFAPDSDAAAELISNEAVEGDVILVKGSRGVRTEKVVEKLLERFELEETARHTTSAE